MLRKSDLAQFLVNAMLNGYALADNVGVPEADRSTSIRFTEGPWSSHDNWFGDVAFAGRQVIFYNDEPVWAMAYGGSMDRRATDGDTQTTYAFLKLALAHIPVEAPFRGPSKFEQGDFSYTCSAAGMGVRGFCGDESIAVQGQEVYSGTFFGGFVGQGLKLFPDERTSHHH